VRAPSFASYDAQHNAEPLLRVHLQWRGRDCRWRALSELRHLLSPIIAAAAMALSSVSVISNALRLRTVAID
jgi:hypothetical protein